jgi:TetR/AcrR family transcriptional regulator, cholesterol catabolism regulator
VIRQALGRPNISEEDSMSVTPDAVSKAATRLFRTVGYEATTTRNIAKALGVQGGSIYYHIKSKESLLFDILDAGIDDITAKVMASYEHLTDPEERLRAAICSQIRETLSDFNSSAVLIALMSPESLTPEHRQIYIAKRDRYERIFRDLIDEGISAGALQVKDAKLAGFLLLGALNGMTRWYRGEGQYSLHEIATWFADMLLDGLRKPATATA